jgi:hypothetical protein
MKISSILFCLALSIAILAFVEVECQETATIADDAILLESVDDVKKIRPMDADEVQATKEDDKQTTTQQQIPVEPVQAGPLIDLLGTKLYSLQMIDETSAEVRESYTNEALAGKKVIGLYFSADWYVFHSRYPSFHHSDPFFYPLLSLNTIIFFYFL